MPSSIFSHQAPGLYIKTKFPKWIDGTAICLSAFIPDVNLIPISLVPLRFIELRNFTHSLIGQLIWTAPLTILLTILFCRFIGPALANFATRKSRFTKPLKYFGVDDWAALKNKSFNKRFYVVAFYSALIGGLTHILLDLPAHSHVLLFYPLVFPVPEILWTPVFEIGTISIGIWEFGGIIRVYNIIWFVEDAILLIISLYLLRFIKKRNLINKWYTLD